MGPRYLQIAAAATHHLRSGKGAELVFGLIDAVKFHQSITSLMLTAASLAAASAEDSAAVGENALPVLAAACAAVARQPYKGRDGAAAVALEPRMVLKWKDMGGAPVAVEAAQSAIDAASQG
uniref:Uncharacterized protein n=1 Tax=Neobodo designis TaxID=312471 RepID=A0A7S1LZ44_NEODS